MKEHVKTSINYKLEKKMNKKYRPCETIHDKFAGYDITFVTNEDGDPVMLFIGIRKADGKISGDRFSRRFKRDSFGTVVSTHWDLQK